MDTRSADNKQKLMKGLYLLLFLAIGYAAVFVILMVTILQFALDFILKAPNKNLMDFSTGLSSYANEVICYLTYVSDKKPFPFSPWPR